LADPAFQAVRKNRMVDADKEQQEIERKRLEEDKERQILRKKKNVEQARIREEQIKQAETEKATHRNEAELYAREVEESSRKYKASLDAERARAREKNRSYQQDLLDQIVRLLSAISNNDLRMPRSKWKCK
jgi:hypothetical protein